MPLDDIKGLVKLTRPENAFGSVVTYFVGYFFAATSVRSSLFVGLLILLLLHSFATVQNDVEDFEIDKSNKRTGLIQEKSLSLHQAQLFCKLLVLGALTLALFSTQRRLNLAVIAGLLLIAGIYNLNPVRASKRPVISIVLMGLCYGALPLIYGYLVGGGKVSVEFIVLAILFLVARGSTSILKDYKDAKGDSAHNKRTFYLAYGAKATAAVSIVGAAVAYVTFIALLFTVSTINAPFIISIALVVLLAILSIIQRYKLTKTNDEKKLDKIFHQVFYRQNQFEGALVLCLILSS
jgi:4-hydroxybenzoate polyprenyltransferase